MALPQNCTLASIRAMSHKEREERRQLDTLTREYSACICSSRWVPDNRVMAPLEGVNRHTVTHTLLDDTIPAYSWSQCLGVAAQLNKEMTCPIEV